MFNWFKPKQPEVIRATIPSLSMCDSLISDLLSKADPKAAQKSAAFHRTNDPESKDIFLGVPKTICKQLAVERSSAATFHDIKKLLNRQEHEIKLAAVYILVEKSKDQKTAKEAHNFLFEHLAAFTSWDIIDLAAPDVIGQYIATKPHLPRDDLYRLMSSRSDWDKRIALQATQPLVENGEFGDALKLCILAAKEPSTMVQKCAGKLLHDVGEKNRHALIEFLAQHQSEIPSAMLTAATKDLPQLRKTIRKETRILSK